MRHPSQTRWIAVTALVVAGMIAAGHIFKLSPAMPVIRQELALGLVAGGWLFSTVNILAAATGVAAGAVADRFGYRRVLFFGLATFVAASSLAAVMPSTEMIFLCRLLEGVGFLTVSVSVPSLLIGETAVHDRPLALAIWSTYSPAGGSLAIFFAPLAIRSAGWQGFWLLMAAATLAVLALVVAVRLKGRPHDTQVIRFHHNLLAVLKHPASWCAAASFGLYTLQYAALMAWLPSYLVSERGLSMVTAGGLTGVVMASNISGNLLAGLLLRRGMRHGSVIAATSFLMAIAAAGIFSALPDGVRYASCILLSAAGGMLPAAVLASAPVVAPAPSQIGTVNGLIVQGSNVGQLLGPPILAAIVAATGAWEWGLVFYLAAATLAMATGLMLNRVTRS